MGRSYTHFTDEETEAQLFETTCKPEFVWGEAVRTTSGQREPNLVRLGESLKARSQEAAELWFGFQAPMMDTRFPPFLGPSLLTLPPGIWHWGSPKTPGHRFPGGQRQAVCL